MCEVLYNQQARNLIKGESGSPESFVYTLVSNKILTVSGPSSCKWPMFPPFLDNIIKDLKVNRSSFSTF